MCDICVDFMSLIALDHFKLSRKQNIIVGYAEIVKSFLEGCKWLCLKQTRVVCFPQLGLVHRCLFQLFLMKGMLAFIQDLEKLLPPRGAPEDYKEEDVEEVVLLGEAFIKNEDREHRREAYHDDDDDDDDESGGAHPGMQCATH